MTTRFSPLPFWLRALAGLLLCVATVGAVDAEDDPSGSASRFYFDDQQRAHALPAHRAEPAPLHRSMVPKATAVGTARKAPDVEVAVYGDRLGQALARGLEDDAGDWLAVAAFTTEDAGLARPDFDDWMASLRARLRKPDRAPVAIMMLGSNDRQPIADGPAKVEPASARWQAMYAARIDAVVTAFHEAHVGLVWVGLPSVRGEDTSADFVRLNALFRDRASKADGAFVDSWEAFSDDSGNYNAIGPDVDGRTVKLRKADGFGFTRAGARKLASFVEPEIKRLRQPSPALPGADQVAEITIEKARDFDQALEIDVNAQIQREVGLVSGGAMAAKPPAASPQPVAGPVIVLTAAPTSPDSSLATASAPSLGLQATLVDQTNANVVTSAHPGRADNFSWPKP